MQIVIFLIGLVVVGIPHGGADELIASKNLSYSNIVYSKRRFSFNYFGNILVSSLILYLFPLFSIIIFLAMAAYHFGETDLQQLKRQSLPAKVLFLTYGILILGLIILPDFPGFQSFLESLNPGTKAAAAIDWVAHHNMAVLTMDVALFSITVAVYYVFCDRLLVNHLIELIQLLILMIILYNLPIILGFTFYFIFWHSIFSLKNIVKYLRQDNLIKINIIAKDLIKNSLIAFLGISLIGIIAFKLMGIHELMLYAVFGLAVLTAPHMRVMHEMYVCIAAAPTK